MKIITKLNLFDNIDCSQFEITILMRKIQMYIIYQLIYIYNFFLQISVK